MSERVAIIYNEPGIGKYHRLGEGSAVEGVADSVTAVGRALNESGYETFTLALSPPLSLAEEDLRKLDADMVFNLFEGFDGYPGSEAAVAGILERSGLCFTGSLSDALLLCENKAEAKQVLRSCGIPTPDWQVLSLNYQECFTLNFPCIVKPLGEHASHGLSEKSVVEDLQTLKQQVEFIWHAYERPSLIEEFLPGREFLALIIGNGYPRVFPIEEIIYKLPPNKPRLLTYSAKWLAGHEYFIGTQEKCPAEVAPDLKQTIETTALQSFAALKCRGYATVDMRQDKGGRLMVIDVNPNTDICSIGGAKYPLEAAGINYITFIGEILHLAKGIPKEHGRENRERLSVQSA